MTTTTTPQVIGSPKGGALSPFDFKGHEVRAVHAEDGTHWFVAADVAAALGYRDASAGLRALEADETCTTVVCSRSGNGVEQGREMLTVSESGLYALAFRSRKREAKEFRRWVTGTVLPTLREHGLYVAGQERPLPEHMTEEDVRVQMAALQVRLDAIGAQKRAESRARCQEHKEDRAYAHRQLRRLR